MENESIKNVMIILIKALVKNPEKVELTYTQANKTLIFELQVAKEDMGRVVGKGGEMLRTIRYFLNSLSLRSNVKSYLELVE